MKKLNQQTKECLKSLCQMDIEKNNVKLILDSLEKLDAEKYLELCNNIKPEKILKDENKVKLYIDLCKNLFTENKKGNISMNASIMLYLKSMLMQLEKSAENTNEFLGCFIYYFIENEEFCYFVWNQIKRAVFLNKIKTNDDTAQITSYIYQRCLEKCLDKINSQMEIKPVQRRRNVVLVMSIQYLSESHAPTKTIIERCKALRALGKEVYFVNTTEQYETYSFLPYFGIGKGKVIDEYDKFSEINMKGEKFNFYQINKDQSIIYKFKEILYIINTVRPEYILSIGTGSILADLSAYIVPCAEMSLVFSGIPHTVNCIPIIGRRLTDEEKKSSHRDVIESRFTFELKEQKSTFTRKQLKIPEDKFVVVIVGIR
ncbi:hypothetical protein KQI69_01010, partial [Eubacterium sp. MSJ-13]|uniref:hypothetical protein n=1 Tax=Eubacterium sp. MSJ-13 TaxID=2841513 RepID=UPI001C0F59F6